MNKPPAIIDNTIDIPGRSYVVNMKPRKVAPEDIRDEWDQAYAEAMELIVDGKVDEGKVILEKQKCRRYYRTAAMNNLAQMYLFR